MLRLQDRRITISATNRLGRRIRHSGLSSKDRDVLETLLLDAFDALQMVSGRLRTQVPDMAFTPRLKTVGTIVEKLRREQHMSLSKMRDLAGIRIVEEMNRNQQDDVVRTVTTAVGGATLVDRRKRPSYGYRAVHLEVDCGGTFVEVQIRTGLQDQWAQVVERLGDNWGRQIRYGDGPMNPGFEMAPKFPRSELWELVQNLSTQVDIVERSEAESALSPDAAVTWATNRRELAELLQRIEKLAMSGGI